MKNEELDIRIEDLIPHRDRMKLIRKVLDVGDDIAVTESLVTDQWPLWDGSGVHALILIEVAAQTAGVCNGWKELNKVGSEWNGKGWLVGIKEADLSVERIPLNTRIVTRTQNRFKFENFVEIECVAKIDSEIIGEMVIQLFGPS